MIAVRVTDFNACREVTDEYRSAFNVVPQVMITTRAICIIKVLAATADAIWLLIAIDVEIECSYRAYSIRIPALAVELQRQQDAVSISTGMPGEMFGIAF